eukprot:gene22817-biopygen8245
MNSCHEGVGDRNRAGIEAADPGRAGSACQQTGRVISRCGKGGVRLYPTKCCHMGWGMAASGIRHSA